VLLYTVLNVSVNATFHISRDAGLDLPLGRGVGPIRSQNRQTSAPLCDRCAVQESHFVHAFLHLFNTTGAARFYSPSSDEKGSADRTAQLAASTSPKPRPRMSAAPDEIERGARSVNPPASFVYALAFAMSGRRQIVD
jgi:hypothetical protein